MISLFYTRLDVLLPPLEATFHGGLTLLPLVLWASSLGDLNPDVT